MCFHGEIRPVSLSQSYGYTISWRFHNITVCVPFPFIVAADKTFFNQEVWIVFLFLHERLHFGYLLVAPRWGTSNEYLQYSLEAPQWGASNGYPHMLPCRNKKTIYLIQPLISWSMRKGVYSYMQTAKAQIRLCNLQSDQDLCYQLLVIKCCRIYRWQAVALTTHPRCTTQTPLLMVYLILMGMDMHFRGDTSFPPFWKEVCSKGKEFAPIMGANSFLSE